MSNQDRLGLRTEAPRLEPDDAFVQRLSQLAAASAPAAAGPRVARSGLAIGLAAASVAALVGGVAWAGGVGHQDDGPRPPAPAGTAGSESEAPTTDDPEGATPLSPGGREHAEQGAEGEPTEDHETPDETPEADHDGDRDADQDGPDGDAEGGEHDTPDHGPGASDQGDNGNQGNQDDRGDDKPGTGPGPHPGNPSPGSPPGVHPGNPSPGTPQGIGDPDGFKTDDDQADDDQDDQDREQDQD